MAQAELGKAGFLRGGSMASATCSPQFSPPRSGNGGLVPAGQYLGNVLYVGGNFGDGNVRTAQR